MGIKRFLRHGFNRLGIDVLRTRDSPAHNLLAMRNCGFATVLDIGANTGQFARMAVKNFPGADILCFEPIEAVFSQLKKWAAGQPQVRAFNFALGARAETKILHVHTEHSPSSSFLTVTDASRRLFPFTAAERPESVAIRTLDEFSGSQVPALRKPILLKMDVQGFEEQVLDGGPNLLREIAACLTEVSLDRLYEGQSSFAGVHARLHAAGFEYSGNLSQVYGDDGRVVYLDALYKRP